MTQPYGGAESRDFSIAGRGGALSLKGLIRGPDFLMNILT